MPTEHVVAKTGDLRDGEMKEVEAGGRTILLARVDGTFHAIGAKCTHYGAPLATGVLSGRRVRCPWHQACFDVTTGDLEEPPALSALPRFDVRVEDQDVIVTIPDDAKGRRLMPMAKHDPDADGRTFAIIGAGAAGNAAAETLRQDGYQGRIVMVTKERHLPYDRPDLSKDFLASAEHEFSPMLRSETFYANHGIEVLTEHEVVGVDPASKAIEFADGTSMTYDKLLVATGGRPRRLTIPGSELKNIFTLRSLADAEQIAAAAGNARRAVVIGAGFIAMETAASLTKRGLSVTVAAPETIPFERTLGADVGGIIHQDHEQNHVAFRLGRKVVRFSGEGEVDGVYLDTREQLQADLVIVGIGVEPITEFLLGIARNDDGSVSVDEHLQLVEDVYAAGDIVRFPDPRSGEAIRIEHWRLAEQHGRVAAHNMAGRQVAYTGVPFFWTNHFKANLRYVGHAPSWDDVIVHGDLAERKFVAYYVKGDRILAAAGCGLNKRMGTIAELMRAGCMPTPDELRNEETACDSLRRCRASAGTGAAGDTGQAP